MIDKKTAKRIYDMVTSEDVELQRLGASTFMGLDGNFEDVCNIFKNLDGNFETRSYNRKYLAMIALVKLIKDEFTGKPQMEIDAAFPGQGDGGLRRSHISLRTPANEPATVERITRKLKCWQTFDPEGYKEAFKVHRK
jgi:hypothetical protein